mmetsp:Transcript_14580/g.34675  ORF Transcript_14580/g.34675 Transcript_14580/m.34675 type:complete len:219 (-) Transcript_14580:62-718(-)
MGVSCSACAEDAESPKAKARLGSNEEPLWKQMADCHLQKVKEVEETRPIVEHLTAARAAVKAEAKAKEKEAEEAKRKEEEIKRQESEKKKETKTKSKSKGKTTKADPKADVAKAETKAVKLTKEQAKEALSKAVAILDKQENKKKLKKVVDACGDDAAKKMAALMPMVKDLLAELLESYGFSGDRILQAVMQIAGHAEGDKKMTAQLAQLQAALEGKL